METQTTVTDGNGLPPLPATSAEFRLLALDRIRESPANPRKTFDSAKEAELEASVRQKGVTVPIKVRPMIEGVTDGRGEIDHGYQIVYGARRFRAARAAGLAMIPALVQPMSDQQALEEAVIENLQRADVHPLEEAEGYRELVGKYGYTTEDLAVKVGKSKAYIYARLKLCAIAGEAKQLFLDGKLTASTALLVARIPHVKLQEEAAREIATGGFVDLDADDRAKVPMSFREAEEYIQKRFMLRLEDAPFALDDATLVKKAGACTTCPKRTGNQPELFADVKSADVCTDPDCFDSKKRARLARLAASAKKEGKAVLQGDDAKQHFFYRDQLDMQAPFLKLDTPTAFDPGRTLRQVLDEIMHTTPSAKPPGVTVAVLEDTVEPIELVDREETETILKKAGIKPRATRHSSVGRARTPPAPKRDVEGEKALALRKAVVAKALPLIVAAAEKKRAPAWSLILDALPADSGHFRDIATRRGLKGKGPGGREQLAAAAARLTDAQARGLAVEVSISAQYGEEPAGYAYGSDYGAGFIDACVAFRIDLKKLEATEMAIAKATPAKTAPSKKGRPVKKATKKARGSK